jgi:hypothetical protein
MRIDDQLLLSFARYRKRRLFGCDAAACQQRLLRHLIPRSARTAFGREYGFSSIRSADEFLDRVPPQSYDDLRPKIEEVLDGRRDVLFPGRPLCFAETTGTEGNAKLIPLNRSQLGSTRRSAIDAALLGGLSLGSMAWQRGKTLYIGPRKARTQGAWEVYAEGTAFAYLQARPLTARFVPKYEDLPNHDESQDWSTLGKLVQRHRITAVAGNPLESVAFARATGIVLPGVKIVFNCGYWAEDLRHVYGEAFPKAEVVDVYGSNEGTFGLPAAPGQFLLNYRRVFFSFMPLAGTQQAVGIDHIEPGRKYRLLVTTPGGLWNYRTGDVVAPISLHPALVRLCGRGTRILSLAGEAVTEDEVVTAVRTAGFRGADYLVGPAEDGYVLFYDKGSIDAGAVDRELRQLNPAYDRLRQSGALKPIRLCRALIDPAPRGKPARIATRADSLPKPKEATIP